MPKYPNIRRRKDGRYEARLVLSYQDGTKKRKSFYGDSVDDVREQMRIALSKRRTFEPKNITVKSFLKDVYLPAILPKVRYSTYELREDAIENHVIDVVAQNRAFGQYRLDDVTPALIRQLFSKFTVKHGTGGRMKQIVDLTLRHAFTHAVTHEYLAASPMVHVVKPKHKSKPVKILDEKQFGKLLKALDESPHKALFLLCCTTAMRQGEVLGLRWRDVDLKRGVIQVSVQMAKTAKGKREAAPPKTDAGVREIHLVPQVIAALKEQREKVKGEWCFPSRAGKPMWNSNFRKRIFYELLKTAKVPRVTFHSVRHLVATLLAEAETNPKALQDMLGHKDYRTTANIYTKATERLRKHTAAKMEGVLSRLFVGSKMGSKTERVGENTNE